MPSFDVVSRTNTAEIDNTINNVSREINQRYDFKDSLSTVEYQNNEIKVLADDEMRLTAIKELILQHASRRGVDLKSLSFKNTEKAGGDNLRQIITVSEGIEVEISKNIIKEIKATKIKVQMAIQGDEIRVSGKKRDDLQKVMQLIKEMDIRIPLQYINFRD
jgi:uncharacterized protein YajQ (UPF0234 family)